MLQSAVAMSVLIGALESAGLLTSRIELRKTSISAWEYAKEQQIKGAMDIHTQLSMSKKKTGLESGSGTAPVGHSVVAIVLRG